jgi:hypothetical protein
MHINLILEAEQRSASLVQPQVLVRVLAGSGGVLLFLAMFSFFSSYRNLQHDVEATVDEWRRTEPKYKAALQLRIDLGLRRDLYKEITGWRDTRLGWGAQLEALRTAVPPMIQLTDLQVSHDLFVMSNDIPARVYELRLSGRTVAAGSEVNVGEFTETLRRAPLDAWIESALIPPGRFRQDSQVKTDRVFEIVCKYKPRRFE